jgi:DNA processing protein
MNRLLYAHSLRLLAEQVHGLGGASQLAILRALPSLEALAAASDEELKAIPAPRKDVLAVARARLQEDGLAAYVDRAGLVIDQHEQAEIRMAAIGDTAYPELLARCVDAPPVLYWRGSIGAIEGSGAAVVGTRKPTPVGAAIADRVATHLASARVAVISGLALGIDTIAHRAALRAGGYTAAVLAQPLEPDSVAPASNRVLSEEILAADGALVSEHPLGAVTNRYEFARRDRIQSGLSRIVLPIQTGLEGGTQNTIRAARNQGRPLWVPRVDQERGHEKWEGIAALLAEGEARGFTEKNYSELVAAASLAIEPILSPTAEPEPPPTLGF